MAKKIVIEKVKFDRALDRLLKTPALKMRDVKTIGKRTPGKLIPATERQ
jgi:hypothetical protein